MKMVDRDRQNAQRSFLGVESNVFALSVTSFLNDVSSEMMYPLLPLFLTTILGAGVGFLGVVEGVAESLSSFVKLFAGWFSDRLGRRKPLVGWGYVTAVIARAGMAVAAVPWHVLAIRTVDRLGKGIRTSPRDVLLAESSPVWERGKSFGFHRGMDHLGAAVGPLIAFSFLALMGSDYRSLFGLAVLPGIMALVVFFLFVREENGGVSLTGEVSFMGLRSFDRRFYGYLTTIFLFALANSSDGFLLLRAYELGVPATMSPLLWLLLHVSKTGSSAPGGMLSDRIGRPPVICLSWILYSFVYLGFAWAHRPWHAWLLFALYGLHFGLGEGAAIARVADLVSPPLRGVAYGLYHCVTGAGALPASIFFGLLWRKAGAGVAFGIDAVLAMGAAILLWRIGGDSPRKKHR